MSGNVWMFSDEIDDEDLELTWRANTTDWESNPLSVWRMKPVRYIKSGKKC